MDENYIDIVRKSLYGKAEKNIVKFNTKMSPKVKKIKFSVDHYNSETVFKDKSKRENLGKEKVKSFKQHVSKKRKAVISEHSASEEETNSSFRELKNHKCISLKRRPKKRKLIVSFSSTDSFEENLEDNVFNPSKSELENFQNNFKKPISKNAEQFEDTSESEESIGDFNLDLFFNTREHSLNESITEAHSGIDNEFESGYINDARIVGSNLLLRQGNKDCFEENGLIDKAPNEFVDSTADEIVKNVDSIVEISNDVNTISDDSYEHNVSEVASKFQEVIVLNGNDEDIVLNGNDEEITPLASPLIISESSQIQQEDEYATKYNAADYYDLEDWKLVVLKPNQSIFVFGLLTLKVLYGKLSILGSVLDKNSKEIKLYSPRGSALLQLTNITQESREEDNINEILSTLAVGKVISRIPIEENTVLIKCTKLNDIQMLFIQKYISQQIFPKIDKHNLPQVIFEPTGNWNIVKEGYCWGEIIDKMKLSTKLILVGGKGVGKSTFLRFAINRCLNKFNKVRVIDLDPGQSEFTIPGCVSIVTVTEPIFGPNYTHLKTHDRSLLSNINVGHNPRAYIKCIQSLMSYAQTLEECPTLINYMGFAQGIGLNIVSSAITYIQPTDIVQICSRSYKKNFKTDLSVEVVEENCNLFGSSSVMLEYNLHKVQAMNDDNDGWTLEPRQAREMCTLSYLGQMMSADVNSLTSHKLSMYEIKLADIKITNTQREEITPAAVNANLVALCSLEEDSNIFVCLGHGVVRGVDLESGVLVLLTPEAPDVIEEVSYLVLGSVMLPPSVYMTPDDVKGSIPYVMEGELISLGQITKRTYLPVNKK